MLEFRSHEVSIDPRHVVKVGPPAELAGGPTPSAIPGPAEADGVSRRLRAAPCETTGSAMLAVKKPYWPYAVASERAAGACLPQRANNGNNVSMVFTDTGSLQRISARLLSAQAFAVTQGFDGSCSDHPALCFARFQTTSHSRFNQEQLVSSMKLAVVLRG
ncbi:hypothetical protein HPB50_018422 [Hyalomma asiaticum]|uniref:Uncharacterized protein n=1 Tax=Hyalomma asiaticum TaxID=266040 RepID=A0ACB7TME8_HYAAI|nr:hypothetical protein HPB50_018422 [Hyalomma asiaticum]